MKYRLEEDRKLEEEKRMEDESKAAANMRLAYQDISLQQKKKVRRLIKGLAATLLYLELPGNTALGRTSHVKVLIYAYILGRKVTQCRCQKSSTGRAFGHGSCCFFQGRSRAFGAKSNEHNCPGILNLSSTCHITCIVLIHRILFVAVPYPIVHIFL